MRGILIFAILGILLFGCAAPTDDNGGSLIGAERGDGGDRNPGNSASGNKIIMEFLYADWCSHCSLMKPIVTELEGKISKDRFEVVWLNEKDRATNANVASIYDKYTRLGIFQGFPTFVINGETPLVGSRDKKVFVGWVCAQFSGEMPQACVG